MAEKFGTPVAVLRRRGRPGNVARKLALLLCRELLSVPAASIAAVIVPAPQGLNSRSGRPIVTRAFSAHFTWNSILKPAGWK